jgi:hypothetical protein
LNLGSESRTSMTCGDFRQLCYHVIHLESVETELSLALKRWTYCLREVHCKLSVKRVEEHRLRWTLSHERLMQYTQQ